MMIKGAAATAAVAAGGPVLAAASDPADTIAAAPLQKAMLAAAEFHQECFARGCRMGPISSFSIRKSDGMDPTDVFSRCGQYVNVSMVAPWSPEPLNAIFAQLATPCGSGLVVARRIDRPTGTTHDDFQDALFNASVMKFAKELAGRLLAEHKAESLAA